MSIYLTYLTKTLTPSLTRYQRLMCCSPQVITVSKYRRRPLNEHGNQWVFRVGHLILRALAIGASDPQNALAQKFTQPFTSSKSELIVCKRLLFL